jgi:mono/diheme cytochrome c family protein
MNRPFLFAIASAILAANLFVTRQTAAEPLSSTNLIWDSMIKATNIITGEKEAHFSFAFTNVSSTNVTILGVQPSCGCTTAQMPPLPWVVAPGTNGQIGIKVNIAATSGTLSKTITVGTDKDSEILTVKIVIVPPPATAMPATNRLQNQIIAQSDRQAVFKGDCARCHTEAIEGKYGKQLYDSVCGVCHEAEHRAAMVPDLHTLTVPMDDQFWRTWISYGRQGSLMPAFAKTENGPLTDMQITTLVTYLKAVIPSR